MRDSGSTCCPGDGSGTTWPPDLKSRVLFDPLPRAAVTFVAWSKDPNVLFVNAQDSTARYSFYSIPLTGGKPRLLFRDDADHRLGRFDFATDGRRLFVTLAADESDVYAMELDRP